MDAVHQQSFKRLRIPHLYGTPESKALRIFEILPEHVAAGAICLILHIAEHIVQHGQLVVLIDQKILIGQTDILFTLKHGVLWIGIDDIRAVDQLFVTHTSGGIIAGNCSFDHSIRKSLADNFSFKVGVKAHDTRIPLAFNLGPFAQNFLHCAICQHVIGINAGVQFCVDVGIGHVVGRVHPTVFLVDILDLKAVVAALPVPHQLCGVVGRAVVYNQPDEVFAILTAQALVGARQGVRPIVSGSKDGENRFSNSVHRR